MITVIDLETTGVDPVADAIIEIAAVDVLPDHTIVNRREHLVKPPIPVPAAASAVHHILYEDLIGKPEFGEVVGHYQGACAYVAHQAGFEKGFLADHVGPSKKTGQPAQWICTYKCALRVWPESKAGHSNQALRYQLGHANPFGIDRKTLVPHRAMSDVLVTAAIFVELLAKARWSQLVQWSNEPPLHAVLSFGKYRGKRYAEVAQSDPDYLFWVRDKSELDEGTKFSASHALQQREAA